MKAILLGAGQGFVRMNPSESYPKCLKADLTGRRVIDWILNSLNGAGIDDITFVGGFHFEKVIKDYPNLKYYINPNWMDKDPSERTQSGALASLFCAAQEMDGAFLASFSDIVYRSSVVRRLTATDADIAIVVDTDWRYRYEGRVKKLLRKAEKVVIEKDNNYVVRIGKYLPANNEVHGEFIGLIYFSDEGARILREKYDAIKKQYLDKPFQHSKNIRHASLTDMLQELIDSGYRIKAVDIHKDWAELDVPQDLAQFVFGTKAETLERLQPILTRARICDQLRFNVDQWKKSSEDCVRKIQRCFKSGKIVVRSSTINEDSWDSSFAGSYCSIMGISRGDREKIISSVNKVIKSYKKSSDSDENVKNQVLIQPQLERVIMSGVLLTRDLEFATPYYIINYDDSSNKTNVVTSGSSHKTHTVIIYKYADYTLKDPKIDKIVKVAEELEQVIGHDSLDIEFAITEEGEPYVFQVRPIVAHKRENLIHDGDINKEISQIKKFIKEKSKPQVNQFGKTTVFGVMPDWNPAEIIGISPRPLALSLYQYLITDLVWGISRAKIGYKDTFPQPLLVVLSGRHYIDVRASFNSFLPASLPDNLSDKIVNFYIDRLKAHPEFHDKVEFEIVATCLSFNFDIHADRFLSNGFSREEVSILQKSLLSLTDDIISGRVHPISKKLEKIEKLTLRRRAILTQEHNVTNIPGLVTSLLNDCIKYGTVPFSILARYAFIGSSFLNSLKDKNIFTQENYDSFMLSIKSVAGDMLSDIMELSNGKLSRDTFIEKYGHLRPGTYDILSPRYDAEPDTYFPLNLTTELNETSPSHFYKQDVKQFELSEKQKSSIAKLLNEYGFTFSVDDLFKFISMSIQARELAKFEFTKNLSMVLTLIEKYGKYYNLSPDDMSYLSINSIMRQSTDSPVCSIEQELKYLVSAGRNRYKITTALRLPHLIQSPEDVDVFKLSDCHPNFITKKRICAKTISFSGLLKNRNITGRIVLIERADPGYDWLFSHEIAGLITKFGGMASHMAIRAAEFGLPAAIGCGETIYNCLLSAKMIELNCATRQLRVIE